MEEKKPGAPPEAEVVHLEFPVEYEGVTLDKVQLRRPTGADLRKVPTEMGIGDMMTLAARLSGLADVAFDRMDASDVGRVIEVVQGFLRRPQRTGETR